MFKWFWTMFSLGAPDKKHIELKLQGSPQELLKHRS